MKTSLKYLLFCGAVFVFWACNSSDSVKASTFNVQYTKNRVFSSGEPIITVISSKNEIKKYYGNQKVKIWDKQGDVWHGQEGYNTIEKYSDNYFANNFLVIVEFWERSDAVRHKVESIDRNGNIVINRLLAEMGTEDIGYWGIIIELNNNLRVKQFQPVFVDVDRFSSLPQHPQL